ncbi:MAG: hypothetical protein K2V38_04485 [Gemmataceae bacterium]|nr:hypothetical protein [Gemmataceae bacterium]
MTATTAPIREDLDRLLAQLSDTDKRYILQALLAPILSTLKEKRSIYDSTGQLLGDFIPFPKVQRGQKIGMTDEEREALSKVRRMSREAWKAEKAREAAAQAEAQTCETKSITPSAPSSSSTG